MVYSLFSYYGASLCGAQLWDLSSHDVNNVLIAWGKGVRIVMYATVHYQTHCTLLPLICNDFSIEGRLQNRFVIFYTGLIRSSNHCIQLIGKLIKQGSGSAASHSLNDVCHQYTLNKYRDALPMPTSNIIGGSTTEEQRCTAIAV